MDKRRNRISSLATSDNSGHTAMVLCTSTQIWQSRTSHVRRTLSEIMAEGLTETLKREAKFNTVECAKFRFKATQNPLIIKPRLVNTGGENTCIHIA